MIACQGLSYVLSGTGLRNVSLPDNQSQAFMEPHLGGLGLPVAHVVKNLPASAGATGDADSVPGLGPSPGGGNGSSCQHSFQDNPKDREVWQAIVHAIAKRWTQWRTLGGLSSSIGFCGA